MLVPGGCTVRDTVQIVESSVTTLQELADAALSEETEAPESGEQFVTAEDPEVTQTADTVGEHGYYYDAEHVVLYLDTYGHLPEETGRTYTECDINTLGGDPAARHSHRPAGRAGRHIVSGHSRHRQFTGSSAVGGHGHRGKGLRVRYAAAVGIFAVRVCVRRAEYGRM